MPEQEKATVDNLPAPTGQNQSLAPKLTIIVSQPNESFNEKISQEGQKSPIENLTPLPHYGSTGDDHGET